MFEGEYIEEINGRKGLVSKVCYVDFPGAVSGLIRFYLELCPVIQNLPALPGREGEGREFCLCLLLFNYLHLRMIGVAYSEPLQILLSTLHVVSPN